MGAKSSRTLVADDVMRRDLSAVDIEAYQRMWTDLSCRERERAVAARELFEREVRGALIGGWWW